MDAEIFKKEQSFAEESNNVVTIMMNCNSQFVCHLSFLLAFGLSSEKQKFLVHTKFGMQKKSGFLTTPVSVESSDQEVPPLIA